VSIPVDARRRGTGYIVGTKVAIFSWRLTVLTQGRKRTRSRAECKVFALLLLTLYDRRVVGRLNGLIFPPEFATSMLYYFLWQSVHRAFAERNSPAMSQNMPDPEPTESSSEEQLRKIASYMRQRLSDSQRQWLATQSDALEISGEQIMSDVLSEWFVRHREAASSGSSLGDFLSEALEEFVARHHQEFLPVASPG
jgi:hypothetical protein